MTRKITAFRPLVLGFLALSLAVVACTDTGDDDDMMNAGGSGDEGATGNKGGSNDTAGSPGATEGGSSDGGTGSGEGGTSNGQAGTSTSEAGTPAGEGGTPAGEGGTPAGGGGGDGGNIEGNLLSDPGFEIDEMLGPWKTNIAEVVAVDPHSGERHGKLSNEFDPSNNNPLDHECLTQQVNFLDAGSYTFRAWVKNASPAGAVTALVLEAEDYDSGNPDAFKEQDILANATTTYKQFTLSGIPVSSNNGNCTVKICVSGDNQTMVYFDDASLTKDP